MFIANSVREETRSRIVQLQAFSRNYSSAFVAIRFDFILLEVLFGKSPRQVIYSMQEANLSLAVLPFFDIAIVGRGNAKRARLSHPVREKRNTKHYPRSLACAIVKFSGKAPMSFVLWVGI